MTEENETRIERLVLNFVTGTQVRRQGHGKSVRPYDHVAHQVEQA